jgi:hypothetical protein
MTRSREPILRGDFALATSVPPALSGSVEPRPDVWTAERFFELLAALSPHRVISVCGPSTFEAILEFDRHGFAAGHMNAITPAYHWHFRLDGIGDVRSVDTIHQRSGRRVLFFELRERASDERPYLHIYLHRERETDFEPTRERRFATAHAELSNGISLEPTRSATNGAAR